MEILDLGIIDYSEASSIQKDILAKRKRDEIGDTIILAEHPPVLTMGRTGTRDNILIDEDILTGKKIQIIDVDRGGDVTFHVPGQLVMYPIVNIKRASLDVHEYIRRLEEVVIKFLSSYGIKGVRISGHSGVWVGKKKIGSIGIGLSRWVSYHGLSVNINADLSYFSMIRSCGIKGVEVTSLARLLGKTADMGSVKEKLAAAFDEIFKFSQKSSEVSALA